MTKAEIRRALLRDIEARADRLHGERAGWGQYPPAGYRRADAEYRYQACYEVVYALEGYRSDAERDLPSYPRGPLDSYDIHLIAEHYARTGHLPRQYQPPAQRQP